MPEPTSEQISPLSLIELNELRRRILVEESFEPSIEQMRAAVQSILVQRPEPVEKKKKAKKVVETVDLTDLI